MLQTTREIVEKIPRRWNDLYHRLIQPQNQIIFQNFFMFNIQSDSLLSENATHFIPIFQSSRRIGFSSKTYY
jgi:hypothetical protein